MAGTGIRIPASVQSRVMRAIYELPAPARRRLAGAGVHIDGQTLDPDTQLLLRLLRIEGTSLSAPDPRAARAALIAAAGITTTRGLRRMDTRELRLGSIPARLYTPLGLAPGSGLLVFYHGGGWVIGNLDTHDDMCRYLASNGDLRVLSVDYRLAPEHRFPAAADDAVDAFRYAVANAAELGANPAAVAVCGDSAGGNLAAAVCHVTATEHTQGPAFALLFYPAVDATTKRESRDLFADGFFLTEQDISWFRDHYMPDRDQYQDPRMSVVRSDRLADFPPTYLTVGGFDPLRDEVVEFGAALADAGVAVTTRVHPDLIHGFGSFTAVLPRAREATSEAVGALRTGLASAAVGGRKPV